MSNHQRNLACICKSHRYRQCFADGWTHCTGHVTPLSYLPMSMRHVTRLLTLNVKVWPHPTPQVKSIVRLEPQVTCFKLRDKWRLCLCVTIIMGPVALREAITWNRWFCIVLLSLPVKWFGSAWLHTRWWWLTNWPRQQRQHRIWGWCSN